MKLDHCYQGDFRYGRHLAALRAGQCSSYGLPIGHSHSCGAALTGVKLGSKPRRAADTNWRLAGNVDPVPGLKACARRIWAAFAVDEVLVDEDRIAASWFVAGIDALHDSLPIDDRSLYLKVFKMKVSAGMDLA